MDRKFLVWAPYFTRSEFGPLEPLLKTLGSDARFEVVRLDWSVERPSLERMMQEFKDVGGDAVLCCFDRPEMVPVAYAAYHNKVPVVQVFAGDVAGGAFDDADRYAISQYASLLFTSSMGQRSRLVLALAWKDGIKKIPKIVVSGPTHFEDMFWTNPPDKMLYSDPGTPHQGRLEYDLVLYNPPSMISRKAMAEEVERIFDLTEGRTVYWCAPNGDPGSDWLIDKVSGRPNIRMLPNMPRVQFLGYLVNAKRFIGNSSSLFYEGPYLGVKCVQVGERNRYREIVSKESVAYLKGMKASSIIAEELYNYLKGEELEPQECLEEEEGIGHEDREERG